MKTGSETRPIMVRVPLGMFEEIFRLCKLGKYRNPADFFYVAGQKELDRVKAAEKLREWERKLERCDCEILGDAEVLPR